LAAALLAMPHVTTATPPGALAGTFGGDRVNATFTANGARLDFDCAVAEIDGAVLPDGDGRFVARGRYLADHPGPIAGDVAPQAVAAVFEGRIAGDTLRLELKVSGEPAPRLLTLVRGQRVKLVRCL
jgi:hypothetical protein